jgi:MYXO-CTERM domain-containing protein
VSDGDMGSAMTDAPAPLGDGSAQTFAITLQGGCATSGTRAASPWAPALLLLLLGLALRHRWLH